MIEARLRPTFQPAIDKLASLFISCRLSSNMITALAFSSGIASAICIAWGMPLYAIALFWISGLCDALDGSVARLTSTDCAWGAYNDLISDRLVEAAIMIGFLMWQPQFALAYVLFMGALLFHFSTFIVAGALFKNRSRKSMHYDKSVIERAEAFLLFSGMLLYPHLIGFLLICFSITMVISGCARYLRVRKYVKSYES